jgi:hypothetical protein
MKPSATAKTAELRLKYAGHPASRSSETGPAKGVSSVFLRRPNRGDVRLGRPSSGVARWDHPQNGRFMANSRKQRAVERAERESAAVEKLVAKW